MSTGTIAAGLRAFGMLSVVLSTFCALSPATARGQTTAQPTAATVSPLETAILKESEATVKAFNAADAAAIAGTFIDNGELVDENGNVYAGRTQITDLFKNFFAKFPKSVLEMQVTSVRPLGDTLAVEEGERRITAQAGGATAQLRYVTVRSKQGERWPIASYREFADDPIPTPQEMLLPVSWLVGDWVDESPDGRTTISYRWSEDGNFLVGDYVLSIGGANESRSTQRIGWDPVAGALRSWAFDSDGGFSHGQWAVSDKGWVIQSESTMPDGSTGSATVDVIVKDADHFTVKSADRIIGGVEQPEFELTIARKPPQPAAK